MANEPLEVVDPSGLTDADWAEINALQRAYTEHGAKALNRALADLRERDLIRYARVIGAFFPNELREMIRDEMANMGLDEADLREMLRKLESPARDQ